MQKRLILCVVVFLFLWLSGCLPTKPTPPPTLVPTAKEMAETMTAIATALTPKPTPTTVYTSPEIIPLLNKAITDTDPFAAAIEARFYVFDVQFPPPPGSDVFIMIINIDCQSINGSHCDSPRTLGILMSALKRQKKIREELVPASVQQLIVITHMNMQRTASYSIRWSDVLDYSQDRISGEQLGARIPTPSQ